VLDTAGLFDHAVATRWTAIPAGHATLHAEEASLVANAVFARRAEFAATRHAAREALVELGFAAGPILAGAHRQPIWPDGAIGSISHDASCGFVAVARRGAGLRSIGVDIELADPLEPDLIDTICSSDELRQARDDQSAGHLAKLIFSVKEAVFKCQFALTHSWLEFEDLRISLGIGGEKFRATLFRDAEFLAAGTTVEGRVRVSGGHILSAAWLPDR